MENVSKSSSSFVLLGIVEMEHMKYLYFFLAFFVYFTTMFLCALIIFVICTEGSLHEPMYLFICNLIFNDGFGSSVLFPKLAVDLLSGIKIISLPGCLIQAFCVHTFGSVELFTFTLMAYDRYLAVGHPLRYHSLMTNGVALKNIAIIWILTFILVLINISLTARLTLCGKYINNIFCDNMSLFTLSCDDTTVNNIFGAIQTFLVIFVCLLIIIYCYVNTFVICVKISKEASQKAVRTLMTHMITFSCFLVTLLFILLRYRLKGNTLSVVAHIVLASSGVFISSTLNPLVYGMQTESLKYKIFKILNVCQDLGNVN